MANSNNEKLKVVFDLCEINQMRTANYADYHLFKADGLVTCGWMDFHTDTDHESVTKDNPYWTIKVSWVSELDNPVFVYYDEGRNLVKKTPVVDEIITFNPARLHGLIPEDIAYQIGDKIPQRITNASRILANIPTSPKLIWEFIE